MISRVWSRLLGTSLRSKIIGLVLVLILLLGLGAMIQVQWATRAVLGRELDERAISIARDVAGQATEMILVEDAIGMRNLVLETAASRKDVRYVLILDGHGVVLAHTFPRAVPPDLVAPRATQAPGPAQAGIESLQSEEGRLREVTVPILGGHAGLVRVGVTEQRVEHTLAGLSVQLLAMVSVVSLLAIAATLLWTVVFTRPLQNLRVLAQAIGRADYAARARISFPDEIGELTAAFNAMADRLQEAESTRGRLIDELRAKERMRLDLLDRLISAQEDERRRVARELHDNTSQALASVLMTLKLLESARDPAETPHLVAELRERVDQLIQEVHDLAWELRPSLLDSLGLAAAVGRLAEESHRRLGLDVDLELADLAGLRFPPDIELAIYRIVQESLTNVARHSASRSASVVLRRRDGLLVAVVEDEGAGFDVDRVTAAPPAERRLGLFGMSERAALVNGRLTVDSSPGRGTTVIAEIPVEGS